MKDVETLARTAVEKAHPASGDSPLAGPKGLAAGAAVAVLPFVVERVSKLVGSKGSELGEKAKESASDLGEQAKEAATDKLMPDAAKKLLGGKLFGRNGESSDDGDGSGSAHGSGRRMPIQQSVDVAVPIKVAYNRWTQFEEWPVHAPGGERQPGGRRDRVLRDQGLGRQQAVRGADHGTAAR